MIGLRFERQLTSRAKVRRWALGRATPRFASNAHDAIELAWVERGRCRYRIGRRTIDVHAGGAILVPRGMEHLTEIDPGTTAGSMWLSAELFGDPEPSQACAIDRRELFSPCRALLCAAESGIDRELAECAVDGLVMRISAEPIRFNGTRDPRIRRAIEEIEARYAEPIDVNELARAARMSRYHFSRVFREETGTSPYRFLIRTRIDRAAQLLASSNVNVTEAALEVGFTDLGRFARAFKAELGRTPSAFLREHRSPKLRHEPHGDPKGADRFIPACESSFSL